MKFYILKCLKFCLFIFDFFLLLLLLIFRHLLFYRFPIILTWAKTYLLKNWPEKNCGFKIFIIIYFHTFGYHCIFQIIYTYNYNSLYDHYSKIPFSFLFLQLIGNKILLIIYPWKTQFPSSIKIQGITSIYFLP